MTSKVEMSKQREKILALVGTTKKKMILGSQNTNEETKDEINSAWKEQSLKQYHRGKNNNQVWNE